MNARWMLVLLTLMSGALAPRTDAADAAALPSLKSFDAVVAALPRSDASGVVLDKAGAPVAGADVILHYQRHEDGLRNRVAGRVKTDAEGKFHFDKAVVWEPLVEQKTPRQKPKYNVIARHPENGMGFAVCLQGDPLDNIKVTLEPTKPQDVTVKDASGKPIEGALVRLGYLTQRSRKPGEPMEYFSAAFRNDDIGLGSVRTGKDGKAKVDSFSNVGFMAEKDGYVRDSGSPKITLRPSASITGRLSGPDGKPVPGAVVWYHYDGARVSIDEAVMTAQDGRYAFKNVPAKGFNYSSSSFNEEEGAQTVSSLVAEDLREGSRLIGKAEKFQLLPGDKKVVDLKLVRGVALAGQVVNEKTGKPVPGFAMLRSEIDGSNYLKNFTTDDQGRFRCLYPEGLEVGLYFESSREGAYILDQEQSGRRIWYQKLTSDKTDLTLKAKLWDTGLLEGVVIDFDGKPTKFPHSIYLHSDVPAVTNGPDGHFKLKVAPRDRDFDLFVIGPRKLGGALVHCKAGATSVTMRTQRFRDYTGVVTAPDGNPANNLKFYLDLKLNGTTVYQVRQEPETNARGMFAAKGLLPTATYYAWWSSDNTTNRDYDYGNATIDLSTQKPDEPITFQARQFINALMGKVVDSQGKPVANAQITIENSEMQPQNARSNNRYASNDKGAFTIDRLAAGKVLLRVTHPNYKFRRVETDSDAIDCVIQLNPRSDELTAKVQVLDEQNKPVPSAPVTVSTFGLDMAAGKTTSQTQSLAIDVQGRGEFKMKVNRKDPLRSVNGALFVCDKPGYDLAFASLSPDQEADIVLRLRPSKSHWSGQVVAEDGKPIAGATVAVAGLRADKTAPFVYFNGSPLAGVSVTDREGHFELSRFGRQCSLSLSVAAPGFAGEKKWIEPEINPPLLITLTRGGSIAGKVIVKETGKPYGNGRIFIQPQGSGGAETALVANDGSFSFEGLKADTYQVAFVQAGEDPLDYVPCAFPTVDVEISKKASVNLEVTPGVPVRGKVVDPATGKAPTAIVIVSARAKDNQFSGSGMRMKPDGSFQFHLAPGTYQLMYMIEGRNQPNDLARTIVIEKGKAYDNLIIEAK